MPITEVREVAGSTTAACASAGLRALATRIVLAAHFASKKPESMITANVAEHVAPVLEALHGPTGDKETVRVREVLFTCITRTSSRHLLVLQGGAENLSVLEYIVFHLVRCDGAVLQVVLTRDPVRPFVVTDVTEDTTPV